MRVYELVLAEFAKTLTYLFYFELFAKKKTKQN